VASVVCLQGRQRLTVAVWDRRVRPSNGNVPFYNTSSRVESVARCVVPDICSLFVSLPQPE
jgi:hypothetical protein